MTTSNATERGMTLLETLIAVGICGSIMVTLAALVSASIAQSKNMGSTTSQATALAAQKIDQLITLQFTATATAAPLVCATSPCGSISADTTGYVEYLDPTGNIVSGATSPASAGVFFTRRWQITNSTTTTKLVEVQVTGTAVSSKKPPQVNMACVKAQQ
jgi:type II secretory pathway pseudopilin PulG